MPIVQSRRHLLSNLALAGALGLGGLGATGLVTARESRDAEPPPEVTTIRFAKGPVICLAAQYVAESLLRAEGFSDVRYIELLEGAGIPELAKGEIDLDPLVAPDLLVALEAREPITIVAGLHAGCYELFANESIRSITDLKGRSVGIRVRNSSKQLVSIMASYVGLDPAKDIRWVTTPSVEPMELFVEGKIDAFLANPPQPQELRARNIGHVIVNSSEDRPWSQYFCCMLTGNKEFVRKYPVATKRALRAILKAADLCASAPKRAAQMIVDQGVTPRYDYALQTLNDIRYGVWRDYDPEDTLRFYALRMQELGMIKSSPQKVIAEGTDWRFLNELKRELKT
jgi:NitT/TauT family transport system substrate-binding protein